MARRVLTGEKLEKELERLSLMREFAGCGGCGDPAQGLPDPLFKRLEKAL